MVYNTHGTVEDAQSSVFCLLACWLLYCGLLHLKNIRPRFLCLPNLNDIVFSLLLCLWSAFARCEHAQASI